MKGKSRILLCLFVTVLAVGCITLAAYVKSRPKEAATVRIPELPAEERVVSGAEETEVVCVDTVVYAVQGGKKYHSTESCRHLASSSKILSVTEKEAVGKGLTPCADCVE